MISINYYINVYITYIYTNVNKIKKNSNFLYILFITKRLCTCIHKISLSPHNYFLVRFCNTSYDFTKIIL
ncbi:hypothetical protein PUN28_001729 [Cardiocondyla obscurior]|uniref:Uncharacterized protein n=1 Tax=Cardiocondyla obscurior TaxID=286306 RepID=A0AAW2GR01_9HYME